MKCFPMMVPLEGRRVLLVGGGKVALRKAERLKEFGVRLDVCAPVVLPALAALAQEKHAAYGRELLRDAVFVVAATDDAAMNARVAHDCRVAGIPVNSVDAPADCDFYFPAAVMRGDISVGISTGGASPALAAALRKYLERVLPPDLAQICALAEQLRGTMSAEEYVKKVETMLEDAVK